MYFSKFYPPFLALLTEEKEGEGFLQEWEKFKQLQTSYFYEKKHSPPRKGANSD